MAEGEVASIGMTFLLPSVLPAMQSELETLARESDPINLGRAQTRVDKIEKTLSKRQPSLAVIIENIHDPHNFNAILRSCDATGVHRVAMCYYIEKMPKLIHTSSSGANKWIEVERYDSIEACCEVFKRDGFRIYGTKLDPAAHPMYDNDFTEPTAFIIGNEHRGISDEAAKHSDELLYIPMMGMVESLNVSVATAVCLFEAMRQRRAKGMYDQPQFSATELQAKRMEWLKK
jgi:tRNA (guanosine-2'-O-)-methyltransferase